ncbi:cell wall teichoic acid glycosylation protein GtcA [Alkalibacterium sp. AK22]|uniref:GtrA family protein n=1 Tax=Alkalibacterium sp. AK22 TaxID=1229520 RepID=UPI00044A0B4B|nr:GtrA family protein [Alkalibacterium sp. AK22]EXJ24475.1 cell wall teichoic acid glycosylation protein GtcA [Alkalibacterium sp. AK22]
MMTREVYAKFHQFIDYFLFGLITATINILVFFTLHHLFSVYYLTANAVAISLAILFSFLVNKKYVFKTTLHTKKALVREFSLFVSLRLTAALMDMAGLYLIVQLIRFGATQAKIIVEVCIAASNYYISKRVIFKKD